MPLGILVEVGRFLLKRTTQPSSLAGLTGLLAVFFSQEQANFISENVQNVIIGVTGLIAIFKSDRSDD
jgi:hypothetical protein